MGSVLIRVIIAPSRKTSTPQDSHSQVKQAHAKLSSISTISQSSIFKTQKTKMKKSSTTLPRQIFNVSPFLRKFSESPTKILRRYSEAQDSIFLPRIYLELKRNTPPFSWCVAVS